MPIPPIAIEEWKPRRQNTLIGFALVRLPSGMRLHDVSVHMMGDRAWALPAAKPQINRHGTAIRDGDGKIKYIPIVSFETKALGDKFSAAVIEALRLAHPDALVPPQ
jgi:hypothetical protein